jgi:hypothetical protein
VVLMTISSCSPIRRLRDLDSVFKQESYNYFVFINSIYNFVALAGVIVAIFMFPCTPLRIVAIFVFKDHALMTMKLVHILCNRRETLLHYIFQICLLLH